MKYDFIYDLNNVIRIGSLFYEKLYNHPENLQYRFFSSIYDDDYDYVIDLKKISVLDSVFNFTSDRESDLVNE